MGDDSMDAFDARIEEIRRNNPEAAAYGATLVDRQIDLWRLVTAMVKQSGLQKTEIAKRMRTSPAAVSRILNLDNAGHISARTLIKLEYATGQIALRYADDCQKCREREHRRGFTDGAEAFSWKTATGAATPSVSRFRMRSEMASAVDDWNEQPRKVA